MTPTDQFFLGPHGENASFLKTALANIVDADAAWRRGAAPADADAEAALTPEIKERLESVIANLTRRYALSIPVFHPRYMAHMIHDASLPALLGLFSFLLANPNNHAYEGGPPTTELELEVIDAFLAYIGYVDGWGHLTSGGTSANLEAAWVARESRGARPIMASSAAHFAWRRIANVLNAPYIEIKTDDGFRMDIACLRDELKRTGASLVVGNLGTTGVGAIDDIASLLELKKEFDFHAHIDAAYGGFLKSLLISNGQTPTVADAHPLLSAYAARQLRAIEASDSITIDPHKHGLATYGCGALFFRDGDLRRIHNHGAPYTYNIEEKPNLGLFSLEGSRAGAHAASCWAILQMAPLNAQGMGAFIQTSLEHARHWSRLLQRSAHYAPVHEPDSDIVVFSHKNVSRNGALLERFSALNPDAPLYVSKFVHAETPYLRSVFMKPLTRGRSLENLARLFEALERAGQ